MATLDDLQKLDIRIGTVLEAASFPEARKPAIKMKVDFGEYGIKQTSAQITKRYQPEEMIGKQVMAILNFPPMRIAGYKSEVLVLGAVPHDGDVVLLSVDEPVPNGTSVS